MNTPSPLRKLGGKVRALRTAAGLTPARLAAAAMIEEEALTAIEAGRRDPGYLLLRRLAEALGVGVGALLSAMDEEEDEEQDEERDDGEAR